MSLQDRTIVVSGGSRGIGLAIALRAARDGANIVLAAKTDRPHPVLPGTVYTAAEQVEAAGGHALAVVCDVRDESQIHSAVEQARAAFGGIDALILNASAIALQGTLDLPTKRYDLMSDAGVSDFDVYANDPSKPLYLDLLVDEPGGRHFRGSKASDVRCPN